MYTCMLHIGIHRIRITSGFRYIFSVALELYRHKINPETNSYDLNNVAQLDKNISNFFRNRLTI